jgi:Protein of unknown function (DUF2934)
MGKKTESASKTIRGATPAKKTKATPPAVAATAAASPAPVKAEAKAPARKAAPKKASNGTISPDDIARRAYYLAEARQRTGQYGSPESDWIEAERQLRAESATPAAKSRTVRA